MAKTYVCHYCKGDIVNGDVKTFDDIDKHGYRVVRIFHIGCFQEWVYHEDKHDIQHDQCN